MAGEGEQGLSGGFAGVWARGSQSRKKTRVYRGNNTRIREPTTGLKQGPTATGLSLEAPGG